MEKLGYWHTYHEDQYFQRLFETQHKGFAPRFVLETHEGADTDAVGSIESRVHAAAQKLEAAASRADVALQRFRDKKQNAGR